jgi:BirA family biotin operon repressor/biotin-[acetyl-CoA-carboxylase] ligase
MIDRLEDLPLDVANTAAELIDETAGVRPDVVAPNDLYLDARKVGGVIVDSRTTGERVDQIVVGIGINLTGPEFDADTTPATSIAAAGGHEVAAEALAEALADRLFARWASGVRA